MMETEGRALVQGLLETQVMEELRRQRWGGAPVARSHRHPRDTGGVASPVPPWKQERGGPVSHLLEPRRRLSRHGEAPETKSKETSPFLLSFHLLPVPPDS